MARLVKSAAVRRDELLDTAERLFLERGYDDTPVQAIIEAAGVAKGTFYHHYPSKSAVLDAVVRRHVERSLDVVRSAASDPTLDAREKLHRAFVRARAWRDEPRAVLGALHRALNHPSNTALLQRIQRDTSRSLLPWIVAIIEQGVAEGVFHTPYPRQTARMVMELSESLSARIGQALLQDGASPLTPAELDLELRATEDAIHRLLGWQGAPLPLLDPESAVRWLTLAQATPSLPPSPR